MSEDEENVSHRAELGNARDQFVNDLQALSTHAQQLLHVTQTVSGEGIAAAREQLQLSLQSAAETLKKWQTDAMDRGRKVAAEADTYVHDYPWQSIAMGAAAGVALGLVGSSMVRGLSARPT